MESKHFYAQIDAIGDVVAFNRTSMESKRLELARNEVKPTKLLIEPVWNRNTDCKRFSYSRQSLLIEPVWNRNTHLPVDTIRQIAAFNRTSMESKHI